ncbi:MAG: ATP-binding protein [Candidatus Taylorbacteria bacterium]|nr:ATP-binding protein [Candidatus Taylorbacteria bacterium]
MDAQDARLRSLYEITARTELGIAEQFRSALLVGNTTLMTRMAMINRIEGDKFTVLYCVVPPNTLKEGDEFKLAETYCDITVKTDDVVAISAMATSQYKAHVCYQKFKLESYLGVPIKVSGKLFGTLTFLSPEAHRPEFSENDKDFVRLMGKWVSNTLEQKIADDKLNAEKEKLRVILESLPVGVFLAEAPSGKPTMVNKKAVELLGRGIDPQAGKESYSETYHLTRENGEPYPMEELPLPITLATGQPSTKSDIVIEGAGGTKIGIRAVSAPIVNPDGTLNSAVVVFEDISKEREIERMKSEFVSVASHQLRTPLTGIKWFVDLMLRGKAGAVSAEQKDFLEQIHGSNERMIALVEDLLNVSRIETGKKFEIKKVPADLVSIIDSLATDLIGLAHKHEVTIQKTDNVPNTLVVPIDADKIRQVFGNLLSNAVKYSKSGGIVTVDYMNKPDTRSVIIVIKDTGLGIPEKQQGRMFEKFFRADNVQTKETDGTGLGLYIAKAIIEGHGGKISFESKENVGTSFFVELPMETILK